MDKTEYKCPICGSALPYLSRYPNYICSSCADDATDENGRALSFFNTHVGGGFVAHYSGTEEHYNSHVCFVRERKCYADEAHLGGIVVELVE